MIVTLGFDIEEFDFPTERGREIDFETQLAVSTEGLEALLTLLARHKAHATFYTTANYAQHRPELVRRILAEGHEVASHDFYHSASATSDPTASKAALEQIIGSEIVGYRAPRLAVAKPEKLLAAGYRYNSSLNPTWIPTRYNNLRAPRTIFHDQGLCIYPVSVAAPLRIPLFWISLHVMPLSIYLMLARTALRRDGHLNLYFHPWEFTDRLAEPQFGAPKYLTCCCGERLLAKLEALITNLSQRGCQFTTTREYLGL